MSNDLSFQGADRRLPPSNIDAEIAILGGIILDPDAIFRALSAVSPPLEIDDFYLEGHRKIYKAMLELHHKGKSTNLLMLTEMLNSTDCLHSIGGRNKLANLLDMTVSAVNIDELAKLVREKKRYRDYIKVGYEIQELGYSPSFTELSKLREESLEKLLAIADDSKDETEHITESLIKNYQAIEGKHSGIISVGVPTGFYDLDAMTTGFQRKDLIIIAGRPSMGKTALAVCCAENIASISKLPVIIFSLEMSSEQLSLRILSGQTRIESAYLNTGRIAGHQWEQISTAVGRLCAIPLYINDSPSINPSYIAAQIKKIKQEHQIDQLGGIVIDYLQLMEGSGDNRVMELSAITRSLKQVAKTFDIPVICLSQLSRSVENRTSKRPMLSDLRDSGCIEQDADLVIFVYRDEYYFPDTVDRGIAELIIAKHRNGPTGTVKLLFEPQFTVFKNLA